MSFIETFQNPPKDYSVIPFWFLNDDLDEAEIKRQLDDFAAHGVYGVVPHARIGLPENLAWMSERWLHFVKVIVDYCAKKGMTVILYDEGMYPSGSCAGQVVANNPRHAARAVERRGKTERNLGEGEEVVAEDDRHVYVHTRSMGHIRGVHFGTDDGQPGAPAAGDILNPEAVASFLHLTHDKHYGALKEHFGKTIAAIFTDEPSKLGRGAKKGVRPWTWGFESFLEEYLGYDFRPHLAALWDEDYPERERYSTDFDRACNARLDDAYYKQYSEWCARHGVALTGHPSSPMEIGVMRHFQLPGQDVVWRYLEPFQDKSLEGEQSTMGKSGFSAQAHYGRQRNLNECFGAYGWEFTYEEMRWLTDWLLVRGVNLISPHAFYYSVRGPRRDERPPDVGPNNVWWPDYKKFADYCRRICWLTANGDHVCSTAILGTPTFLPWKAARALFERQWDFNYLDTDTLLQAAQIEDADIVIQRMRYTTLIIDGDEGVTPEVLRVLQPLIKAGRVVAYGADVPGIPNTANKPAALMTALRKQTPSDVTLTPATPHARFHHVRHAQGDAYFFTNEGPDVIDVALQVAAPGKGIWYDAETGEPIESADPKRLNLPPYTGRVLFMQS
jgi:hypothetical protein